MADGTNHPATVSVPMVLMGVMVTWVVASMVIVVVLSYGHRSTSAWFGDGCDGSTAGPGVADAGAMFSAQLARGAGVPSVASRTTPAVMAPTPASFARVSASPKKLTLRMVTTAGVAP
jgi:hypothetical protein